MSHQFSVSASRKLHIHLRHSATALLEYVQDVDRFGELGYVKNTVFKIRMNSDLANPRTNAWHSLPVLGNQPLLQEPELVPTRPPCVLGKCAEPCQRSAEPHERLLDHERRDHGGALGEDYLYNKLYCDALHVKDELYPRSGVQRF